jgi:hypothetical protein
MKLRIPPLFLSALLLGCSSAAPAETAAPAAAPTSRPAGQATPVGKPVAIRGGDYDMFGDGVAEQGDAVTVAGLAANSKALDGTHVRLTGTVQAVCKKKGCWMRLTEGDKEIFVKFKDYAFFMPLDCEGREAVLEGTFSVKETPVDELKHYLEDEGKHAEAAKVTEPKIEMKVLAAGVALRRKA